MTTTPTITAALLLAACSLAACSRVSEAQPVPSDPVLHATLATVEAQAVPRSLSLTGSLVAEQESDVAPDTAGKVLKTFVERGQVVAKGAPLARLDVRAAALAAADARAQREAARAQERLARADCGRSARLFDLHVIPAAEHDRDLARCAAAQWTARAAEARARIADKAVGDGVVRAPFAGLVAERAVAAGEYVRPDSRIVTLLAVDPLRLELTVSEQDLRAVHVGQQVSFQVAALPTETFAGSIRYVGPAVRRASRDSVVEAIVDNPAGRLRPGLFAIAHLNLDPTTMPVVPAAAVRRDGQSPRVFVAVGDRLEERVVQLGTQRDGLIAVTTGLRAGERVATDGGAALRDGARIR